MGELDAVIDGCEDSRSALGLEVVLAGSLGTCAVETEHVKEPVVGMAVDAGDLADAVVGVLVGVVVDTRKSLAGTPVEVASCCGRQEV